ncbi:interleukin-1 family member 10-like [Pseudonaja textilis]|uniref:interleukin-1 family member 10-like n=1 Tax=Pseudonaja textilis TaxID=8673 RepID=UPI000EA8531B|nr:interleukin-1 family member 10-like [Pseudonaja textilis]
MGDDMLVASPNDSNSTEQLIAVLPNNALEVRKQAIFMGIQPNTVINCVQTEEGQLQLQLMSGDIMYLYKQNEKFLNFSFYSKTDGSGDTCSFKSAQFPGWFLSIYSEAHKPIGLSPKGGPENILFHFQRILSQKFYFQREMEKIVLLYFICHENIFWLFDFFLLINCACVKEAEGGIGSRER